MIGRSRLAGVLVSLMAVSACGSDGAGEPVDGPTTTETSAVDESSTSTTETTAPGLHGDLTVLPVREGPRKETTGSVPHVQIGASPISDLDAELRSFAVRLPGVEDRESVLSLPGARGLWLTDDLELARADVLGGSREFAHIHPDGSLHVWLPVERAQEVHQTKWGELHPWVSRDGFWDGVVMIYTPETQDELDITIRIIVDAYNFVTSASLSPDDVA